MQKIVYIKPPTPRATKKPKRTGHDLLTSRSLDVAVRRAFGAATAWGAQSQWGWWHHRTAVHFSELFRFHTQLYLYFILTIWEFGHLSIIKSMLFKSHRACTSHANTPPSFPFPPSAALVPKGTFRAFPKGKRWRSQGVWGWHQKSSSDASDVDFPGLTYFHTKPWLKGHQVQLQAPDQNLEIRYPNVQWL